MERTRALLEYLFNGLSLFNLFFLDLYLLFVLYFGLVVNHLNFLCLFLAKIIVSRDTIRIFNAGFLSACFALNKQQVINIALILGHLHHLGFIYHYCIFLNVWPLTNVHSKCLLVLLFYSFELLTRDYSGSF